MLAYNACVRSPLLCTNAVRTVMRQYLHIAWETRMNSFFMFLENNKIYVITFECDANQPTWTSSIVRL